MNIMYVRYDASKNIYTRFGSMVVIWINPKTCISFGEDVCLLDDAKRQRGLLGLI
jgi:hypothetical protein